MFLAALRGSRHLHCEHLAKWASAQALLSRNLHDEAASVVVKGGLSQTTANSAQAAAASVSGLFKDDATETAKQIASVLSPAQRVVLAAALREQTKPEQVNEAYIEELYLSAAKQGPMTMGKFRDVIMAHVLLNDNRNTAPPSTGALRMLFFASAIPFIAFGFLDNFIMLTVGEEIDSVFGARLGLTTLASAGLGNLVADVIGVSAAKAIEQSIRNLPFIKDPRLSRTQKALPVVKMAKASGSTIGVMIGCCLGLLPLALSGNFFKLH